MASDKKNRRLLHLILSLVSLTFLVGATFFLVQELRALSIEEIFHTINSISYKRLAAAITLCIVNYSIMVGYDWIGLWYAGVTIPFRKIALTSIVGDTLNNNLGLSAFVGSTIKFRFYSALGVSASSIARAIGFYTIGYWLGFSFLSSISFLYFFPQIAVFGNWGKPVQIAISMFLMLPVAFFTGMVFQKKIKKVSLGKLHIDIPTPAKGLSVLLVGILDWTCTGVMFYLLMPQSAIRDVFKFVSIYVISHIAGMVSQVPGGIAVFESAAVLMNGANTTVTMMASLLVFRVLFFIAPFILGLCGFFYFELKQGHRLLFGRKDAFTKADNMIIENQTDISGKISVQ
ncbi:MAG: UPF0104 family protein [Chitinispirillaceae bacterium]|nr:UPF0104 family protein [Chitinispirillaceae bacterium]